MERARKGKGAGANQPSILTKLKPVEEGNKQNEKPVTSPSSVGELHDDGVRSGDREQDGSLSREGEQHGDGLRSVGVAEVPTQDMSEVSIDKVGPKKLKTGSAQDMSEDSILSRDKGGCGTEKCAVSDAQLSSQCMSVAAGE